jgi:hypothetical protein
VVDQGAIFKIEVENVTKDIRQNELLDEFFGGKPAGGASTAAGAVPKGGPNFPTTVLGPDGKAYSLDAYLSAQKKAESQKQQAEARSAFESFFAPPPLPKTITPPDTVKGSDGQRYKSTDAYFKEREKREKEEGKEDGGILNDLLGQLGLGRVGKAMGGGGEALGGAAKAAAIAAPALLAIEVGTKSLRAMTAAVDATTKGLEGLVQNDLSGIDEGMNDFRTSLLGTIPILGDAANAGGDFARALTSIPSKLDAAFLTRARELSQYSADISFAEAKSEARGTLADVREADALGADMARLIDAETELKMELRELILPIKKVVVEVLADRLELIVGLVKLAESWPQAWEQIAAGLGNAIVFAIRGEFGDANTALNIMKDWLAYLAKPKDDDTGDLYDRFFGNLGEFAPERP